MAFNSAALSAGIGSMLQGMQQSAQQKLQLAQMERQQRIEDENLKHQRAMEDLARQQGNFQFGEAQKIAPLTLRDLTTRVNLGEKLSPFQVQSAEEGVRGQIIQNKAGQFNVDKLLPLGERTARAQADLAEGTTQSNIDLAKQAVQGNTFNVMDKAKARYSGAIAAMKTASAILNNPQSTGADRALAFKEYNANQAIVRGAMSDIDSMSNLGSLFGDRATIMANVRGALNIPQTVTDEQLAGYLQQISPDMAAPAPATGVERFGHIGNIVQNAMSQLALNPESRFVDWAAPTLKGTQIVGGDKPAAINRYRLAEAALPSVLAKLPAAKAAGYDSKTVWNTIGTFTDKDFDPKTGELLLSNPTVKRKAVQALADQFVSPEKQQESLLRYQTTAEDKLKSQVQLAIASMNKALGMKTSSDQLKAALAATTMPLVNVWTSAYSKANDELEKLASDFRKTAGFDIKSDLPAAFMTKVKTIKDTATQNQARQIVDRYKKVQDALGSSLTSFVKTGMADNLRIAESLRAFAKVNISPDAAALAASGLGAPAPASGGGTNSNLGIPGFDGKGFDPVILKGGGPAPR